MISLLLIAWYLIWVLAAFAVAGFIWLVKTLLDFMKKEENDEE